jgi:hypothetical protein
MQVDKHSHDLLIVQVAFYIGDLAVNLFCIMLGLTLISTQ